MSYADDVRGALAATSGVSRRVQALRELKLGEDDEKVIQGWLDDARAALLEVMDILKRTGHMTPGASLIAAAAGNDKSWRERVYGGQKDTGQVRVAIPGVGKRPARTYEEVFGEPPPPHAGPQPPDVDLAHPWRSGEERK